MGASKFKRIGKQGLLIFTLVSLIGGLKAASNFANVADAVVPAPSSENPASPQSELAYLVCSEAADWQRPTTEQQQKQLTTDARYGELVNDKEFQAFAQNFWHHDALSFTTYGLSARMEPVNLSGLWSVADDVWHRCYSENEGNAINAGDLAETWLMNYQVVDLQWQDDHYAMVVEPKARGMQVVQFARQENAADLPLTITTRQGDVVEHYGADW